MHLLPRIIWCIFPLAVAADEMKFKVSTVEVRASHITAPSRSGDRRVISFIDLSLRVENPVLDEYSLWESLEVTEARTEEGEPLGKYGLASISPKYPRRDVINSHWGKYRPGQIVVPIWFQRNGQRKGMRIKSMKGILRIGIHALYEIPVEKLLVGKNGEIDDRILRDYGVHLKVTKKPALGEVVLVYPYTDHWPSEPNDKFSHESVRLQCKDRGNLGPSGKMDKKCCSMTFDVRSPGADGCRFLFILPSTASVSVPFEFNDIKLP